MNWRDVPESLKARIEDFFDRHPEWSHVCIQSGVYAFDGNRSKQLGLMARHYDCDLSEAIKALDGDQSTIDSLRKREASRNELWKLQSELRQCEELPIFA